MLQFKHLEISSSNDNGSKLRVNSRTKLPHTNSQCSRSHVVLSCFCFLKISLSSLLISLGGCMSGSIGSSPPPRSRLPQETEQKLFIVLLGPDGKRDFAEVCEENEEHFGTLGSSLRRRVRNRRDHLLHRVNERTFVKSAKSVLEGLALPLEVQLRLDQLEQSTESSQASSVQVPNRVSISRSQSFVSPLKSPPQSLRPSAQNMSKKEAFDNHKFQLYLDKGERIKNPHGVIVTKSVVHDQKSGKLIGKSAYFRPLKKLGGCYS